jgi:hypothetical protein
MRFTDQHLWNIVFTILFIGYVVALGILLKFYAPFSIAAMTPMELLLLALASLRLTRLFVYDKITAFWREQFLDTNPATGALVKPGFGVRRTLADLFSCPWCVGMWAAATVVFFYYYAQDLAWYPILFLAIASLASFLQVLANMIGWRAEKLKREAGE